MEFTKVNVINILVDLDQTFMQLRKKYRLEAEEGNKVYKMGISDAYNEAHYLIHDVCRIVNGWETTEDLIDKENKNDQK